MQAISCLIYSYLFTCARYSTEVAIGLPVWLLSYYQTEVVGCHPCMISDSLNKGICLSDTRMDTMNLRTGTLQWHVFTPVHSLSWISLWAFTKHHIYSASTQGLCVLGLCSVSYREVTVVWIRILADNPVGRIDLCIDETLCRCWAWNAHRS